MIEISHAQARRWLRQSLDRRIPEWQWSALQGHFENCAECRTYRDRRSALENKLRRDLRAGWSPVEQPAAIPAGVLALRRARLAKRGALARAGWGLGILVALVALLWGASRERPPGPADEGLPVAVVETAAPSPSPSPTPVFDGDFRGVLAFEAPAEDGRPIPPEAIAGAPRPSQPGDIFLLAMNTGSAELTNLTTHPARDFAPSWSPDGNWIAFLSERDREEGADIYVISVAGTGLRRLTADLSLTWSGPLAWNPDGSWIAATGAPANAGGGSGSGGAESDTRSARQIYRVAPDASRRPGVLPDSQGGANPRFSPTRPILAFLTHEGELSFLRAYHVPSGETRDLTRAAAQVRTAAGYVYMGISAYDWTADGEEILYVSRQIDPLAEPSPTLVRVVPVEDFAAGGSSEGDPGSGDPRSRVLASFPSTSPVVSATLSPEGELFVTRSFRRFGQGPRCRPLAVPDETVIFSAEDTPGGRTALCIESGLDRASWTSDGRWMVVAARDNDEQASPGFYALTVPGAVEGGSLAERAAARVVRTERLADLPGGAGTPRVRPTGNRVGMGLEGVRPTGNRVGMRVEGAFPLRLIWRFRSM